MARSAPEKPRASSSGLTTESTTNPIKLDKAGLYDLAQIKRALDDELISVRRKILYITSLSILLLSYNAKRQKKNLFPLLTKFSSSANNSPNLFSFLSFQKFTVSRRQWLRVNNLADRPKNPPEHSSSPLRTLLPFPLYLPLRSIPNPSLYNLLPLLYSPNLPFNLRRRKKHHFLWKTLTAYQEVG